VNTRAAPGPPVRVLVVDDQRLFRDSLAHLLAAEPAISVVGQAEDGEEALRKTAQLLPAVVLMDVVMPRLDGIHATAMITSRHQSVRVLMLASDQTDETVLASLRAGAVGYVAKDVGSKGLIDAVLRAADGRTVLDAAGQSALVAAAVGQRATPSGSGGLTPRQFQILKLMSLGFALKQIARELGLAEKTVRNQASLMYGKLMVRDRAQAILYAMHKGLVA
jgi:DNA-binding NarL/FixJ family response regulator